MRQIAANYLLTRGLLEREVRNNHSPRAGLDVEFDSEPPSSCGISRGRGEKEKETNMESVVSIPLSWKAFSRGSPTTINIISIYRTKQLERLRCVV